MAGSDDSRTLKESVQALLAEGDKAAAHRLLVERCFAGAPAHEYRWLADRMAETSVDAVTLKVAFLSTYTVEPLRELLRALALAHGVAVEFYFGGFGQLEQEVLKPGSGLEAFEPDAVVLAWRLEDLLPGLSGVGGRGDEDSVLETRLAALLDGLADGYQGSTVLAHTFDCPASVPMGVIDYEQPGGLRARVEHFNAVLRQCAESRPALHLVDTERVARRAGAAWFQPRHWYSARAPHGPAALLELSREYAAYLRALAGRTAKVVMLDLDNTLWGGVLGEDGADGVELGPDYPGNAFVAFQQELKGLAARGVLLVLNSKNNEDEVRGLFASHPHMLLGWDDFAASRVNWQDKASNAEELADELGLGLDSFVFVDDSPHELEVVGSRFPGVSTVQVPADPAELPGLLSRRGYFESLSFSAEDSRRGELYRAEGERKTLRGSSRSLDDFYRSLNMRLRVHEVGEGELARVAQLTQKTNQFNMTTRRYSEAETALLLTDDATVVRAYSLVDRFGDSGIVSVVIARKGSEAWELDSFLMSCRVIGRTVETAILALIADEARAASAGTLVGDFLPTKKNAPASGVYEAHGFVENGGADGEGGRRWSLDLGGDSAPRVPAWIEIAD